ncbi:MAG: restriction endonuclease subunit S, partial [Candidatus Eremiobacterota bacterium]
MTISKIPDGYKQTEVGVIPEDWEVKKLADCCSKITDGTHDTPKPTKNGIPFLTAIHVKNNFIDFHSCYYLPQNIHNEIYKRCNPEFSDVLMVNIGAGIATTALVNVHYEFSLKNVALLKPDKIILIGSYLNYFQSFFKKRIISSISSGGAQPFLSLKQISEILIALPNKIEQSAIANALSDTDSLINSLEQLIAKKRAIKQGAIEELLTGKRRLPGFSGEWKTIMLGEIFEFKNGLNKEKHFFGKGTPIVNYMDVYKKRGITSKDLLGKVTLSKQEIKTYEVRKGDVLFTRTSETVDEVGVSSVMLEDVKDTVFSGFVLRARPINDRLDIYFKKYCFSTTKVRNDITSKSSYTTRALTNGRLLSNVKIIVPPTKAEQTAIAEILSDMDTEIESLEQKLE